MNNFLWRQLRQKRRLFLWLSLLTILLVVIDQVTKYLAVLYLKRQPLSIAEGVFSLHYFENTGTGFGLFADNTLGITIINFIILFVLLYWILILPAQKRYRILQIVLTFTIAGAIGNMIDRCARGYVIDFFYFELINFPIFNMADIYVTVSLIVFVLLFLFYYNGEETNRILTFRPDSGSRRKAGEEKE
ncbi:MAG: signal peptidase II [Lachnospiraceae bacterium]